MKQRTPPPIEPATTDPELCADCGGYVWVWTESEDGSFERIDCPACDGTGDDPGCAECGGSGCWIDTAGVTGPCEDCEARGGRRRAA